MTSVHPLWNETISFADKCSWKAGHYLAERMRNNEFSETERVLVAAENEKIIGYCTFSLKDELPEDSPYSPFIGFMFVDEGSRGKRISERLINAAVDHARTVGHKAIYIMSGEQGLYEKYGFEKVGDFKTIYGSIDQLFQKHI
ncbi:MAG: GNAT family N-acetyltransferase [Lachnospiraceae bacterium]|nr:GNAT family N-acetyltransferase [Lachnospiraceae bacterium]